ncbi:MAG: hypothetical protein Q9164_003337 [Protoblastenia rupestris]
MTALSADIATKCSTDATQKFVESYYPALNSHRNQITTFYTPTATMPDGKPLPIIVWNGNVIPDPASLQKLFEEQMPRSYYDVQDYDCHVLNPNYVAEGTQGSNTPGKNMTILVTVSGYVKYGESRSVTARGFSENFVLVPNTAAANTRGKHLKEWLIQSQNFRLVV